MAVERTFSIIKPDATARNLTGAINAMIEQAGLRIIAQRRTRITREEGGNLYAVPPARPLFGGLLEVLIFGAGVVEGVGGEDAAARSRGLMGGADPAKAAP